MGAFAIVVERCDSLLCPRVVILFRISIQLGAAGKNAREIRIVQTAPTHNFVHGGLRCQ